MHSGLYRPQNAKFLLTCIYRYLKQNHWQFALSAIIKSLNPVRSVVTSDFNTYAEKGGSMIKVMQKVGNMNHSHSWRDILNEKYTHLENGRSSWIDLINV